MEGWISLYRKFVNWQWYKDSNVKAVFIHLLLCANHKEEMVGKRIVYRGQLITSRDSLSEATGLTPREIRTCLSKLKATDEIELEITNKYSVITIKKYDFYQRGFEDGATSKTTSKTTSKKEAIATSKNDIKTTSKINLETIENSEEGKRIIEKTTSKKEVVATNKNSTETTNKKTNKTTTNNNIYNNINNNNMTRLDYIFNLIINNEYEKLNFEKVKWESFKLWLKRIDLNVTENFINFMEIEKQLEYKIIFLALLKLYKGTRRVYISKLNKEHIFHKLLKAKEYKGDLQAMNEEQIKEFANYYLKCLENFIDGSDNNEKV